MTTQVVTNWKKEWFEIEDATYLNTAAHTVMPRVSLLVRLECPGLVLRVPGSRRRAPNHLLASPLTKSTPAR